MIAGIRASNAVRHIFRHNDLEHLEALLRQTPASAPKLIAVESVYSMDADIARTVVHLRLCLQPGHLGDGPKLPPTQIFNPLRGFLYIAGWPERIN